MVPYGRINRLLGYPAEARLLVSNADDFGMCHAVNEAIIGTLQTGIICSITPMVLCPWAQHAMHFLAKYSTVAFGVHLAAVSERADARFSDAGKFGQRLSGF